MGQKSNESKRSMTGKNNYIVKKNVDKIPYRERYAMVVGSHLTDSRIFLCESFAS